jgi:cytoskeletal protein RodZ
MATVGEMLRAGREAQKSSIHQVAEATKIRTDHIRALEAGDYDCFVAPVYIRGFVRTYATLLKLDVPQVMALLDGELSRTEKFRAAPPLDPTRRGPLDTLLFALSRVNWARTGIVVAALAVLTGVGLGLYEWRKTATSDPLGGLKPILYQPTQQVSGATQSLPATPRKP